MFVPCGKHVFVDAVAFEEKGEKTGALLRLMGRGPVLFSGEQGEHGIGHVERKFAGDCQRRAANQEIVEMLHLFAADQQLDFTC
ncbi:hypothetical protein D3C87_1945340 [compost metagenome]